MAAVALAMGAQGHGGHGNKVKAPKPAKKRKYQGPHEGIWQFQPWAESVYRNQNVEYFVAALIVGNFIVNVWEKQVDPTGNGSDPNARIYNDTWLAFETFFNVVFLIELVWNMYAFWFWDFWTDSWNIFDFFVVSIGVITMTGMDLGPFKLLRLMRAFRVFRLFKRVKSLNKIIVSLGKALPGMRDALLIQVIVMSIFAMLGVEFFSTSFMPPGSLPGDPTWADVAHCPRWTEDGLHQSIQNSYFTNDTSRELYGNKYDDEAQYLPEDYVEGQECYLTSRGQRYGYEYYGTFFRSLYTLFQVLTGDSWSEAIARPMIERDGGITPIFYVLFVVINAVILVNVVVAVLLEKMVDDGSDEDDEEQDFLHQKHEFGDHDAKATMGELWDFKQEMRNQNAVMQAQLDALTANIEALCKAQSIQAIAPDQPVLEQSEMFDTKGKRMTDDEGDDIVKCWFPASPPKDKTSDSGEKVHPVDNSVKVEELEDPV